MRNNNGSDKTIEKRAKLGEKNVFVRFRVSGHNLERLTHFAKKRGLALYNLKKSGDKSVCVSVLVQDCQKFFAITEILCYNIKKLKMHGKGYPLFLITRHVGVVLGVIVFSVLSFLFNDRLYRIDYDGSGYVCHSQVQEYLNERGIVKFSRFSDINLKALESEILSSNQRLSFVSCSKKGNVLKIYLAISGDTVKTLDGDVSALYSKVSGVVENIKVYRGTALVKKGDAVSVGQLLVDGYSTVKDKVVPVNVIASVTVAVSEKVTFELDEAGLESKAEILALESFSECDILDCAVQSEEKDGKYYYTATVRFLSTVTVG